MILVDANILIYAGVATLPKHRAAREWLDGELSGSSRVGLPWASVLAYLRVTTNPRAFSPPVPTKEAWRILSAWLAAETAWIPEPTDGHKAILGGLLARPGIHGDLVPDAHLAALAIEHGLTLCSADRDFARFPGLRWVNPLAG